jgi:uncharacterized Zn finger protein
MLIPLICNQCGGQLEVQESQVSISGDTVVVLPHQEFRCPHCGTKYLEGTKSKYVAQASPNIVVGNISNVTGSINISRGTIIGNFPAKQKSQPKKWWQFWK